MRVACNRHRSTKCLLLANCRPRWPRAARRKARRPLPWRGLLAPRDLRVLQLLLEFGVLQVLEVHFQPLFRRFTFLCIIRASVGFCLVAVRRDRGCKGPIASPLSGFPHVLHRGFQNVTPVPPTSRQPLSAKRGKTLDVTWNRYRSCAQYAAKRNLGLIAP